MHIWVDADACPRPAKEILFRASQRLHIQLTLVANKPQPVPQSPLIRSLVVAAGFDVADRIIVEKLSAGDLVISADIPLASDAIARGALVLDPRGELLSPENIGERLSMRNFMDELRGGGVDTGGPPAYGQRDRQAFANQLDRILASARLA